jgi:hypothetical protein
MPLNAMCRSVGFTPLVSSRARACAFSITDSVTTIEREVARPWTREAIFTEKYVGQANATRYSQ